MRIAIQIKEIAFFRERAKGAIIAGIRKMAAQKSFAKGSGVPLRRAAAIEPSGLMGVS
jgi:hypothetical protein